MYYSLSDLMTGPDQFNWTKMDKNLAAAAGRKHHHIIRVAMDRPDANPAMPKYFKDHGVKIVAAYESSGQCPDYKNSYLQGELLAPITAKKQCLFGVLFSHFSHFISQSLFPPTALSRSGFDYGSQCGICTAFLSLIIISFLCSFPAISEQTLNFIKAFGARYGSDNRIFIVQCGLVGA